MIEQFIKNLEATQNKKFTEQEKQAIKIAITELLSNQENPMTIQIGVNQHRQEIANDVIFFLRECYDLDADIDTETMDNIVSHIQTAVDEADSLQEYRNDIVVNAMTEAITIDNPINDIVSGEEFAFCSWCKEPYPVSELNEDGYCHQCYCAIKSRGEIMK